MTGAPAHGQEPVEDWLAARHRDLCDGLSRFLDPDAGLRETTMLRAEHAGLLGALDSSLDTQAGLDAILQPPAAAAPSAPPGLNVAEDHALAPATPAHSPGRCDDAMHGAGGLVNLKLGHYSKDGIKVIDVAGTIDIYTAPRLRELLIDLVSTDNYQLIVNLERVEFLDSTGLGVLVGGLKRVRAHDGSLDLVCTQERILKIFRITGLTKAFGIHQTVDQAIAAKGRR